MSALPFALRLTCCCCCWLTCFVILVRPVFTLTSPNHELTTVKVRAPGDARSSWLTARRDDYPHHRRDDGEIPSHLALAGGNDAVYEDAEGDFSYDGDEDEDYPDTNITEKGRYLGSPCEDTCHPDLQHVHCDSVTGLCECEKLYPVRLGHTKGCAKPKKLGEQCFYRASCTFVDQHATCAQVQHNAVCDCDTGYHRVALSRPSKKVFCAEDLVLITTDMPTLLGIASGLAVFTGLICFVLKLFSRARYTRPRHYANANHAPPMLFSSDTGSRRPSLASVHSSTSSARSYSARRLERERNDKEQRQALQELRLARSREQQEIAQQIVAPTPSPRTPHSTDELLPSVEEGKEVATTSAARDQLGSSSTSLPKQTSASFEASTMPKRTSTANETSTMPKRSSATSVETAFGAAKRMSASSESSTPKRTTMSNESSAITIKRTSMSNETAFTAPSACTSAFAKELSSNRSSSIDIFES